MKISEHLKRGIEIAQENHIKQTKSSVFVKDVDGEICEVCAIGNILLSVLGVEKCKEIDRDSEAYNIVTRTFPSAEERNGCVRNQLGTEWGKVYQNIFSANDSGMEPQVIAEKLEECGL